MTVLAAARSRSLTRAVSDPPRQVLKDKLYDAFYRLTDSRSQMSAYVFDVIRATGK